MLLLRRIVWISLLSVAVHAQYFSKGWSPGPPVPTTVKTAAVSLPSPSSSPSSDTDSKLSKLSDLLDPINLIQLSPVSNLLGKFGVNVSEGIENAKNAKKPGWDERIPLIDDDNFDELVGSEGYEDVKERVWVLVITVTGDKQEGISKFVDEAFDDSFNRTRIAGDLPNVKWGRIDYMKVTYLTTKWAVWRAPVIVILQDRGQTLRFYQANQIKLRDGALRELLLAEAWKLSPPWTTAYSPGGSREWLMHNFALVMRAGYDQVSQLPRWLLMVISGALGSMILGLMHRQSSSTPKPAAAASTGSKSEPAAVSPSPASAASSTSATAPSQSPKKRKGKGKK